MAKVSRIIREDAKDVVSRWPVIPRVLEGITVLVTGAGGFLCSFILDVLAASNNVSERPAKIIALDNFKTGLPERVQHLASDENFEFVTHDVTTPYEPPGPLHWIIHGASIASPSFYRRFPLETIDANVAGTRLMLDLAKKKDVRGFLQLSSSEIYGDPEPAMIPTSEDYVGRVSCTGPRACYDESKRVGETLSMVYHRLYGVPVKIVRPFNVYGPGQRLDDARIIPDMMSAALDERPIVLYSDGRATRAFCYIADFVGGVFVMLLEGAPGEAYNVGNAEEVTIAQAAEIMAKVAGSAEVYVDYRASDDPQYLTDNPQRRCPNLEKAMRVGGWRPSIPLADGLRRTMESYREEM